MATRREIADEEEQTKISLEKAFTRDLRSIFNRIKKDFGRRYMARGQVLDVSPYRVDFTQSFRRQYERVQDKFLGSVIGQHEDELSEESLELLESIAIMLLTQNLLRAEQQSAIVTETTQANIGSAVQKSFNLVEDPSDRSSVAGTSLLILSPIFASRSESIAMTETQIAAENTKAVEARSYSAGRVEDTKTWVTVGDDRVRETHRFANGQTVEIRKAFSVGNSLLQYPGDTSLGAELKEVINCRCSAVYSIRTR